MATRQETNRRREALRVFLRGEGRRHAGAPVLIAPVRELAEQHAISANLVCTVLQELTQEGVLHTVPRVGTFVGAPRTSHETALLILSDDSAHNSRHRQMRMGFEDRVAARGGNVLTIEYSKAIAHRAASDLPPLLGVFDLSYLPHDDNSWAKSGGMPGVPHVRFRLHEGDATDYDLVCFNDSDGARQATRHLIDLGHTRIAFLAMHSLQHDSGLLEWSSQREIGWSETLQTAGLAARDLAFHPTHDPLEMTDESEVETAREATRALLQKSQITAVVAANDNAARGLLQALKDLNVPHDRWPAVVGFDGDAGVGTNLVTSLRLPWEEIGRAAADLIYERRDGKLPSPTVLRQVPMRLIPRLTSRRDWRTSSVGATHTMTA